MNPALSSQIPAAEPEPLPAVWLVRLLPQGQTFACQPGQTVLQAAETAGIALPSSCRNGTCRTCLCRVLEGNIETLIEWPGLSAEEKTQGYFLPCVSGARSNLLIQP